MGLPIKTLILTEIINNVSVVVGSPHRVFLDPWRGLKEELVSTNPCTIIITFPERFSKRDLYAEKEFDFETHTWIKADTDDKARELATSFDAQIQARILPRNCSIRQYCQYLETRANDCFDIAHYEEGLCVVLSGYSVRYRHLYLNPTQQNP
jgi:hypothetical protein